jgi:hypothetical protein
LLKRTLTVHTPSASKAHSGETPNPATREARTGDTRPAWVQKKETPAETQQKLAAWKEELATLPERNGKKLPENTGKKSRPTKHSSTHLKHKNTDIRMITLHRGRLADKSKEINELKSEWETAPVSERDELARAYHEVVAEFDQYEAGPLRESLEKAISQREH